MAELVVMNAPSTNVATRLKNIRAGKAWLQKNILSVAPGITWKQLDSVLKSQNKMNGWLTDLGHVVANVTRNAASVVGAVVDDPSLENQVAGDLSFVGDTVHGISDSPQSQICESIGATLPASAPAGFMAWIAANKIPVGIGLIVLVIFLSRSGKR